MALRATVARNAAPPRPAVTIVVPTVGASPWLAASLAALRREDPSAEILVVDQSPGGVGPLPGVDRVLRQSPRTGFAAANIAAFGEARGHRLATVNDDALVEPGWLGELLALLDRDSSVAAVQGLNLRLDPAGQIVDRLDGAGIAWNRWWQAIQLGHGDPTDSQVSSGEPREVFGVAATAAVFRRRAFDALSPSGFDPRLVSYYEDVDLAVRLRAAGFVALVAPAARAGHAGSTSGGKLPHRGLDLIYGNRWLVLARMLGSELRRVAPVALARDLRDLAGAAGRGQPSTVRGILGGWRRYLRLRHSFLHDGPPLITLAEIRRLSPDPP